MSRSEQRARGQNVTEDRSAIIAPAGDMVKGEILNGRAMLEPRTTYDQIQKARICPYRRSLEKRSVRIRIA